MMRENQPKDTSLVLHWCSVQNAGCAAMPTEMPALSSANASLLVINSPSLRKSLKLLWQQRGPRKWEVFQAPKSPKAKEGPLPTTQGMEQGTRRAPRRIHCSGRRTVHQVLLTNSGCSASRSHATDTRTTDYVAVPEEAAPLERLRSVTKEQATILDSQSKIANWLYNKLLERANDLRKQYRESQDKEVGMT